MLLRWRPTLRSCARPRLPTGFVRKPHGATDKFVQPTKAHGAPHCPPDNKFDRPTTLDPVYNALANMSRNEAECLCHKTFFSAMHHSPPNENTFGIQRICWRTKDQLTAWTPRFDCRKIPTVPAVTLAWPAAAVGAGSCWVLAADRLCRHMSLVT